MSDPVRSFGDVASQLARNPLGIIALFIVLVYGCASLTTIYAENLMPSERSLLIYFLVLFPVCVLLVFVYLVIFHSGNLYAPSDFRDEGNYMKLRIAALPSARLLRRTMLTQKTSVKLSTRRGPLAARNRNEMLSG